MRRATVTIPDDLERELERYLRNRPAPPSLTTLMQAALRSFLREQRLAERSFEPAGGAFRVTPAAEGSGHDDVSVGHDDHLHDGR
jgi:hypothetical protein